jgi:hypothetical protein
MEKGLAIPNAMKYLEVLQRDTAKNKSSIMSTAGYLAQYYANVAKDKDKAIQYLETMLALDPTNESIKKNLDILKNPAPKKGTTNPKGNSGGSKSASPNTKTKTSAAKPAVVKK